VSIAIAGIGIHPFGRFEGVNGLELGAKAVRAALGDAGIEWGDVQFAFGGTLGGAIEGSDESIQADQLVGHLGLSGIPFTNVHNGCATAGSTLALGMAMIESGAYDLGVCVGFDKHPRGHFNATPEQHGLPHWYGDLGMMITTQFFGMKINRYMHDFGITNSTLAKVAAKNFRNGAKNPNAWRRKPWSEEEILESRMLNYPLTQYMFCSPNEGAAAVVLCSEERARQLKDRAIRLRAVTLRTRTWGSFEVFAPWLSVERGHAPTVDAARACFEAAGIAPADVDLAQLQDGEAGAEVMHMSETGLCADGEQEALIQAGETEIGGRLPVNTDGGLIANGEPIGASGMRQVVETVLQLRGDAGERQVPGDPQVGFTQVYGAPGVSCCTILTR
jgi:acetyl-CoA acetyltransferase